MGKFYKLTGVLLVILLTVQNGIHCNRVRWQQGDPIVEIETPNDLSSKFKIISLTHIVNKKFPDRYKRITSQQLTYVLYMKVSLMIYFDEGLENFEKFWRMNIVRGIFTRFRITFKRCS